MLVCASVHSRVTNRRGCWLHSGDFLHLPFPPLPTHHMYVEQDVLQSWDAKIKTACLEVNGLVDEISSHHSKWAAEATEQHMSH